MASTFIDKLEHVLPLERVAWIHEHTAELEALTSDELDKCGTLLCHGSSEESRKIWPIIGDHNADKQDEFDSDIFGNPLDPETVLAPSLRADVDTSQDNEEPNE